MPEFGKWEPIETAPKGGQIIIVPGGIAHWYMDMYGGGGWYSLTGFASPGRLIQWELTHWMPLPPPPAACYLGLGQTEADRPNCICPVAPAIARAKLLEELAAVDAEINWLFENNGVHTNQMDRQRDILAALKEEV